MHIPVSTVIKYYLIIYFVCFLISLYQKDEDESGIVSATSTYSNNTIFYQILGTIFTTVINNNQKRVSKNNDQSSIFSRQDKLEENVIKTPKKNTKPKNKKLGKTKY
ncbi:hypothetical protein EDEG_03166 [Edhazardia aedis USNM 41457]|uniref:Uncharacterized protein n=1 Tax=Edhazardia aedis (strain USNM 41457) TaxID=1003232 RepID=J9DLZ6_EDHAE|nr:hypothetical protein EDEG_03166 [Edhazardia aedis USNM 41457]|eukprot:EJW02407.1 hypothetical protein EDEG_03166 [Edhazardia aedis USNM 41457]